MGVGLRTLAQHVHAPAPFPSPRTVLQSRAQAGLKIGIAAKILPSSPFVLVPKRVDCARTVAFLQTQKIVAMQAAKNRPAVAFLWFPLASQRARSCIAHAAPQSFLSRFVNIHQGRRALTETTREIE
jgi:hypothetical protein